MASLLIMSWNILLFVSKDTDRGIGTTNISEISTYQKNNLEVQHTFKGELNAKTILFLFESIGRLNL